MGVGRAGEVWVAVWRSVGCYSGVECRQHRAHSSTLGLTQWGAACRNIRCARGHLVASFCEKETNKQTIEGGWVSSVYNNWDKSFIVRSMIMKFTKNIQYCCDIKKTYLSAGKENFALHVKMA